MDKIKKFIIKLFRIKTYETEYNKCNSELNQLKSAYNISLSVIESYKHDLEVATSNIERLTKVCEEPLALIDKEVSAVVEQYEQCVEDFRDLAEKYDRMQYKSYAEGRAAAYSEMGIWNIESHERGNCLVQLKDGSVVELINQDLMDVSSESDNEEVA